MLKSLASKISTLRGMGGPPMISISRGMGGSPMIEHGRAVRATDLNPQLNGRGNLSQITAWIKKNKPLPEAV